MLGLRGRFVLELERGGRVEAWNAWTDEGLLRFVQRTFGVCGPSAGGRNTAEYYLGLIDDTGFTALANADTASSHAGWAEITTGYGTDRTALDVTIPVVAGVKKVRFNPITFGATLAIRGVLVCTENTIASGLDCLLCHAELPAVLNVVAADTLTVTYYPEIGT